MKEKLEKLINDGLSTREISKNIGKSQTTVRYWLKKFELKTINSTNDAFKKVKKCCKCKEIKNISEFYKKTDKYLQPYCKHCLNQIQIERWRKRKIEAIKYKGSCCVKCGARYPDEPSCVFDFHHLQPEIKEMSWNELRLYSDKKIKEELDKCILLCSNCHRKIHNSI